MQRTKKFSEKLCKDLSLLVDVDILNEYKDATLLTEDGWSFDVHRMILANKSIFFRDLFSNFMNDTEPIAVPKIITGGILNEILYFIYTDSITLDKNNFLDFMIASDFLQVDKLYLYTKEFAEAVLSIENCLQIYIISLKINETHLQKLSYRVIQINFERLLELKEADLMEIELDLLQEILKDNNLCVNGENIVWKCIKQWTSKDPQNRFKEIRGLLKCLKIDDVDELLAKEIIHSDVISKNIYFEENVTFCFTHSNLEALKCMIHICVDSSQVGCTDIYNNRLPEFIHVIICRMIGEGNPYIYVTYDENTDLWRKLGEIQYPLPPTYMHVIESNIFVSDVYHMNFLKFSLYDGIWRTVETSFLLFVCSVVVGNSICFISRRQVKFYDTKTDKWSDAMNIVPVSNLKAVSFQNKIFIVGKSAEEADLTMLVQVYDKENDSWSMITPPTIYRSYFYLVVLHGKLYIIGGKDNSDEFVKTVEVFDIAKNEWDKTDDLPFVVDGPDTWLKMCFRFHAPIFNDRLFVYHVSENGICQYVLNENYKSWEKPKKPLPVSSHIERIFKFYTIYDRQIIKALVKENRQREANLEKSPFQ